MGEEAHVLDGGLRAWRDAGLPTAAGLAATTPASLTSRPRNGYWVGKNDLVSWSEGAVAATVVSAISPEVYRGEVPSRYARHGHIRGRDHVLGDPDEERDRVVVRITPGRVRHQL